MEPLTLPLAIAGVTEFVKLAAREFTGIEIKGATTIVIAAVVAVLLTFVSLDSEIIQNVYSAAVVVGGFTGLTKFGQIVNTGK